MGLNGAGASRSHFGMKLPDYQFDHHVVATIKAPIDLLLPP
jgi:hypothetical protein